VVKCGIVSGPKDLAVPERLQKVLRAGFPDLKLEDEEPPRLVQSQKIRLFLPPPGLRDEK